MNRVAGALPAVQNQKGAHSSIESLLKRVEKGSGIDPINPLVDLYNSVSLRFGLPCGGEDLHTFAGDLHLTVTKRGHHFIALGDETPDNTLPGEVCYLDDVGAVCRCWNWRDGQRTMLTGDTKNAFPFIESVNPARSADLQAAVDTLAELVQKYLGSTVQTAFLNSNYNQLPL